MMVLPQTNTIQNNPFDVKGWDEHLATWDWSQGEHVTLIGPTGCGKTTLTNAILHRRKYVVFVATKPKDPVIQELVSKHGFILTKKWSPRHHRQILHPIRRRSAYDDRQTSRLEIARMLDDVYVQGGWTVVLDELRYVTSTLGLAENVELLWLQGRAMGATVIAGAQRPRHVPLAAYSQAKHIYLWRTRDQGDAKRMAEFSGEIHPRTMQTLVGNLPDHACVYACQDGTLYTTGVDMNRNQLPMEGM